MTMETSATGMRDLGREPVYYNSSKVPSEAAVSKCHRCGREGHRPTECRFRGVTC